MGVKRTAMMVKVFKYRIYEPGQHIIVEGERGLSFFIIVSGNSTLLTYAYKEA
jgi:CRP-like cAMP-binding protein